MTGTLKTTLIQNPSSADVNITLGTAGEVTLAKSPVLNGSTSGTLTLAAPAVAGTNTITFPAATDTVATLAATQTLTNKTIQGGAITSATAQSQPASPAVANVDFTSIPSWVKRITVMFSGVSTSGTSPQLIQLGDSGGVEITGYLGAASTSSGTGTNNANYTTGFGLTGIAAPSAGIIVHGSVTITALDLATNLWACAGVLGISSSAGTSQIGATKTLSGTLTQVRITTVNGTDTFDAGTINIMYE